MKHPLDPRKSRYRPDHEAAEALEARRDAWLAEHCALARLFRRMHFRGAHFGESCGSLRQLATRLATKLGYDETQA
jgi:hypothetical protein